MTCGLVVEPTALALTTERYWRDDVVNGMNHNVPWITARNRWRSKWVKTATII